MSKERREQERFSLQLQVKFSIITQDGVEPTVETLAANISAGGAFIQTDQELPIASKVNLEFYLDFEDLKKLKFILSLDSLKKWSGERLWVKATGVVIRTEPSGAGIIFDTDYQLSPMQTAQENDTSSA